MRQMDLFMKQTQGHREQTWVARGEERGGLGGEGGTHRRKLPRAGRTNKRSYCTAHGTIVNVL